ncbi:MULTISPECIES: lipopolysaccharide biosynthesis protein [Sphingobacterium]|uniref:lipopolysaccharide biosynthesis protein n=1 Tax=Sphingobacterium TaxID=28453 RepID=UPI00257D02F3|nr:MULTISPECIES: lipopolysaccharide biosynthesis protein [Sphingobacterium]
MSLRSNTASGLFWTIIHMFGSQGVSFFVQLVLARLLLPEAFGMFALLQVFIAIGVNIADSGMNSSLIRTQDLDEEDYSSVFWLCLSSSVFIYLVIFFLAPPIAKFYNLNELTPVLRVYCLTFIVNAFASVQVTRLIKAMKFKEQLIIQLPSMLVSAIISIAMAKMGAGIWAIVFYNLFQNIIVTVQYWLKSDWKPKFMFNKRKLLGHFRFGYKLTLDNILNAVFDNIYSIIIGKFFSTRILGFYSRAELFQLFPSKNIATAVEKVTYPTFVAIQDDNERLRNYYKEIFRLVVFCLTPIMVLISTIAVPFFRFVLTEKWVHMAPYFQSLTLVGILHPYMRYNINILKVKGRSDLVLKLNAIRKGLTVICIVCSIPLGLKGIILSQNIVAISAVFLSGMYSSKMINYSLKHQFSDTFMVYLTSALMALVVFLFNSTFVGIPDWVRILLSIILGGGIYLFVMKKINYSSILLLDGYAKQFLSRKNKI